MQRFVASGHGRIGAIHGQKVLNEIVGADAQEVNVRSKKVSRDGRAGQLNIDSHRWIREGNSFGAQGCLRFPNQLEHSVQVPGPTDERNQYLQGTVSGCTEQCTKLDMKRLR